MVFGLQKLHDQIFCLQEERNYFQAKYLEQVSELQALRNELQKAKKEIVRLREEVMGNDNLEKLSKPKADSSQDTTILTEDDNDDDDESKTTKTTMTPQRPKAVAALQDEDVALRQSAEKLLQWASYRSMSRTNSPLSNKLTIISAATNTTSPALEVEDEKKQQDDCDEVDDDGVRNGNDEPIISHDPCNSDLTSESDLAITLDHQEKMTNV